MKTYWNGEMDYCLLFFIIQLTNKNKNPLCFSETNGNFISSFYSPKTHGPVELTRKTPVGFFQETHLIFFFLNCVGREGRDLTEKEGIEVNAETKLIVVCCCGPSYGVRLSTVGGLSTSTAASQTCISKWHEHSCDAWNAVCHATDRTPNFISAGSWSVFTTSNSPLGFVQKPSWCIPILIPLGTNSPELSRDSSTANDEWLDTSSWWQNDLLQIYSRFENKQTTFLHELHIEARSSCVGLQRIF